MGRGFLAGYPLRQLVVELSAAQQPPRKRGGEEGNDPAGHQHHQGAQQIGAELTDCFFELLNDFIHGDCSFPVWFGRVDCVPWMRWGFGFAAAP